MPPRRCLLAAALALAPLPLALLPGTSASASSSSSSSDGSAPVAAPGSPQFCDPASLAFVNCPLRENDVDWVEFLRSVCESCPLGRPCDLGVDSLAFQVASKVASGRGATGGHYQCIAGVLASMIVVSQFYLLTPDSAQIKEMLTWNRSLRPFPFHTSQFSLYTNMVPLRLMMCDADPTVYSEMENRFVPKAHLENTGVCGIAYSDELLVRRCRARRKGGVTGEYLEEASRRAQTLREVKCPSSGSISVDPELHSKISKYTERGEALHCSTHKGMWQAEMSDQHKCVLVSIAHFLGFRPGQLVFDWGSGCGHKLSWAKMLFDVNGLGLDIMSAAVAWASVHSAGTFCHADGRDLRWVPDGLFDFVISYAAIYHLSKIDQCHTGLQLVGKLRVGGKAFLGWNRGDVMTNWEWMTCLRGSKFTLPQEAADASEEERERLPGLPGALAALAAGVEVDVEAVEDGFLFPRDVTNVQGNESFLFQYPSYSLILTRIA